MKRWGIALAFIVLSVLAWWAAGVAIRYVHQADRPFQVGE